MASFLLTYYLWIKALHIIAIIAWMAGMLYLPRLYVYHADAPKGSNQSETFKVMERRLLRFIMNPAMIASLVFGVLMIWANPDLMKQGWMHAKMAAIILMLGLHGVFSKWRKVFERDENTKPAKFYKIWNEAPTLLMVIIVIMAVAEPF
ncbi:protoporphyrinogen oxidase HemJ [Micavibrio aeruginosavorus]|uniref:protoporphyrinogen oxidase HemJ n=1 Tax=Micavibrio aeruginosavorus TaxID=349221 RepID=UPI003F4A8D1B